MRTLLSLLAFGALAACAVEDPAPAPEPAVAVSDLAQASTRAPASADDAAGEDGGNEDVCGLLPCDGPCSLACDYEALIEQYVPPGTCASFYCHLTDGRPFSLDGCRAEENVEAASRRKHSASDGAGG
ncbi:MAG: hypothetical protein H0T46_05535 [Deltaproteobacteria bacterium]|nr:hypothetical protein [Deltaproteobacteria bacterium]